MTVVLTGAAGGIGSATAHLLVNAGARVVLVGRTAARLTALARALAKPSQATVVVADITTAEGRSAIHAAAIGNGANVLVNNAGLPCFGRLDALQAEHIATVLETNLVAPVLLTRQLLPHLRAQPAARILNVGSALGSLGLPGFSIYSAAKFGLRGFSEALRRELHDTSIIVQYLAPRVTRTAFNDAAVAQFNRATGAQSDSPEQVARALVQTLERGSPERFLGFPESFAARVNGIVPRLLDRAFRRHRAVLQSV
jgi:short-subunit dehydrogenase